MSESMEGRLGDRQAWRKWGKDCGVGGRKIMMIETMEGRVEDRQACGREKRECGVGSREKMMRGTIVEESDTGRHVGECREIVESEVTRK